MIHHHDTKKAFYSPQNKKSMFIKGGNALMVTYRNLFTILNLDELQRNTGEEIMGKVFRVFLLLSNFE